MHVHTCACLSASCVYACQIQDFRQGGWEVRVQLVEKSSNNLLVLNLFYSGGPDLFYSVGPMVISKKL